MLLQETVVESSLRFFEKAIVRYRDDADLQDIIDFIQEEVCVRLYVQTVFPKKLRRQCILLLAGSLRVIPSYRLIFEDESLGAKREYIIGCVRLAFLGRPRSSPVRSPSFDVIPGAHPSAP